MSTPTGAFDLDDNAKSVADLEDEGQVVHIRDLDNEYMYFRPDGGLEEDEPRPVTVTVAGTYSNIHRRAVETQTTKALKRRGAPITGEMIRRQKLETVARCILAWDGFFKKGAPIEVNKDNALEVLRRAPWIMEQLEVAMDDHGSFFGRS